MATKKLSSNFYKKLAEMSSRLGMNPADMLLIMYLESAGTLDSSIKSTSSNASGLTQIIPSTLRKIFNGTPEEFRKLDADEQLPYIEKYFQEAIKGKKLNSTQFYIANLLPAKLSDPEVINKNRDAILAEKGNQKKYTEGRGLTYDSAYRANPGLDFNKDGVLTYGDIEDFLNNLSKSSGYQKSLKDLQSATRSSISSDEEESKKEPINVMDSFVNKLIASMESIVKSITASPSTTNNLLIKITSPHLENNLEFARILSSACEDLASAKCRTYAEDKEVEVLCKMAYAEENYPLIQKISFDILNQFSQKTNINDLNISIVANKSPSYSHLDIKMAEKNYRKFMLKIIGNNNG
jgi:hypothetical protein